MREDGNSNSINAACAYILVADQPHENQWIFPCGSSRIVEYYASNVTWSSVQNYYLWMVYIRNFE